MEIIEIEEGYIRVLTKDEKKMYNNRYSYVVTQEYKCRIRLTPTACDKDIITLIVPENFLLKFNYMLSPDWGCGWVFHEWLYASREFKSINAFEYCPSLNNYNEYNVPIRCTKEKADELLYLFLEKENISIYHTIWILYARLLPFISTRIWNSSKEEYLMFIL